MFASFIYTEKIVEIVQFVQIVGELRDVALHEIKLATLSDRAITRAHLARAQEIPPRENIKRLDDQANAPWDPFVREESLQWERAHGLEAERRCSDAGSAPSAAPDRARREP
jgi:hypothetical protein